MIVLAGHINDAFLDARPLMWEVIDDAALPTSKAWDAAWDDLFHCWCGCPL